eukprot:5398840-Prorocentrum_lima.AAC.1
MFGAATNNGCFLVDRGVEEYIDDISGCECLLPSVGHAQPHSQQTHVSIMSGCGVTQGLAL